MRKRNISILLSALTVLLLVSTQSAKAQFGKLVVHTVPAQAFVYADGNPIVDAAHHFLILEAGEHKIDVYNYGYKSESRTVTIEANKSAVIDVTLQAVPGTVTGPWGCITVEGANRCAVLLNGKDPAFFVGHGDEFNHEWGWKQELIVPPGKYELTVIHGPQHDVFSMPLDVEVGKRVIVDAPKGVQKTEDWSHGQQMQSLPRFQAGTASARVAIEKVTGQFSSSTTQINCGESAHLTWSSEGAGKVTLNDAAVSAAGDQTVQPKQTTDYKFIAAGPGGVYSSNATLNVNTAIAGTLGVTPAEVRYHKIGDKVDQQGTATLNWSAGNADATSVDPFGSVGPSGNKDVQPTPAKTTQGPVDEIVTYTLHASNACGGSETRTASLHITGSIDSGINTAPLEANLTLNSIYFPTNLPTAGDTQGGLLPSEQQRLASILNDFKQYMSARPEAKLILEAHADHRGSSEFNKALSQRRADRVKSYLIENGISADGIETRALGKEQNLTDQEVKDLAEQNPNITPEDRERVERNINAFRMANNRRVDIRLSTTGQSSKRFFPYNSDDLHILMGVPKRVAN